MSGIGELTLRGADLIERFYRIEYNGQPRYAIERDGDWRLIDGDIFDGYSAGEPIPASGLRLLAPVEPSKEK